MHCRVGAVVMNGDSPPHPLQLTQASCPLPVELSQSESRVKIEQLPLPESFSHSSQGDQDASHYTTTYYTTVEPPSRESSPQCSTELEETGSVEAESEGGESLPQSLCVQSSTTSAQSEGTSTVKHWSYEEQFKQLYNMSPEAERKEFLDKLFDYMQKKGTPITRVPIMAKQPLDLYRLFKLVVERGGLVEVIKKKAWRNVAKELNLPASITSAAFTMRSQYVKYLYPYECETEKLSNPQELQMAIDSNKRDRRHSESVDQFMPPQITTTCRADLERVATGLSSPVAHTVTAAPGLQLISSPTVAIPQGSLPPYSGGFIVTPGGHMVGQQISSHSHQIVQVNPHSIPIMIPGVPNRTEVSKRSAEGSEDSQNSPEALEPPSKKACHEMVTKVTVANPRAPLPPGSGSFVITQSASGAQMVPASHLTSPTPQLFQVAQQPIPMVVGPNDSVARIKREGDGSRSEGSRSNSGVPAQSMLLASQVFPSSTTQFVQMPPGFVVQSRPMVERKKSDSEQSEGKAIPELEKVAPSVSVTKMPFANISIQSAGKDSSDGTDASLLVTLELNSIVYQGVLFAKPSSVTSNSPQR